MSKRNICLTKILNEWQEKYTALGYGLAWLDHALWKGMNVNSVYTVHT